MPAMIYPSVPKTAIGIPQAADVPIEVVNFKPDRIMESTPDSKYTSYSVNKGEKIFFCIRAKDSTNEIINLNTLLFVAIHEMAHVMTKSIGHTKEFWNNFRFLLRVAVKNNIYQYQNFSSNPGS